MAGSEFDETAGSDAAVAQPKLEEAARRLMVDKLADRLAMRAAP